MAGQMCKEKLGSVLMQAMLAAKNLRPQHDGLLQARRQLQQQLKPSDNDISLGSHFVPREHIRLTSYFIDLYLGGNDAAARPLATCLQLAADSGARLAPNFAAKPEEELFDALVAQRLPERPTTQAEAFSRVEAAFYAVRLSKMHHLPRCVENLIGRRVFPVTGGAQDGDNRGVDLDKARDYLDRTCTLLSLGVEHTDLAVGVISSFLDPKEVASVSAFADGAACVPEDHFLQVTSSWERNFSIRPL